jgi:hypothetical protein
MREQTTLIVPHEFLRGEPTHALHEAPFDLSAIHPFVQRLTTIVQDVHTPHLHHAGEAVDFHFTHRRPTREIVKRPPLPRRPIPPNLWRRVEAGRRQ